ncbi:uncharacterized protein K441DRAFT_677704 [Cenococcum geophilum 1.58]|uniref:uncharacterized protein n=1 Tax=Cenococcum geophilum 1.58 TaxID=794803 RepID=UPI00358FBFC9|nr:hypothetical protein K441DRAFT_677704 [Cenococcum geophilum 1.58]
MNANKDSQASARNAEAIVVGSDEVPKASDAERGIRTSRQPRAKDLRASKQATLQGRWRMEATMGATTENSREAESQISIATGTEKSTGIDMGMGVAVGTSMTMCRSADMVAAMTLQSSTEEMTKSTTAKVKRLQDEVADLTKLLNIEQNQKKSLTEELERSKLIQNQALQALDERFQDLVEAEQELEEKVHDSKNREQCLEDLDANLQQHRREITGLGEQLMTCQQNLASMEERAQIAESSLSGAQTELTQSQTVIFENKAVIACLRTKCDAVEAELEKAERKLTSTSQELVACYRLSEEKAREISKLEAPHQLLVSERQQLSSKKQMLEAEVRKLTEDIEISKSAMMKMNASIEDLERQIEELKAAHKDELDRIYTAHEHETNELEFRWTRSLAGFRRAADNEINAQKEARRNALDEMERYYLQVQEHMLEKHKKDDKTLSERIKTLENSVRGKEVEATRLERDLHTAKHQASSGNSALQCELEKKMELLLKYKKFEEVMASSTVADINKAGTEGTPAELHRLPDVVVIIIHTTGGSSWSQIQNAYLCLIARITVYSPDTCVGVLEHIGGNGNNSAVQPVQPQRITGTMRVYGSWPCFRNVSQHSLLEEAQKMLEPFDVKQGSFYRSQRIILISDVIGDAITEHDQSRDAVFERLQSTGIPVHCLIASAWQPRDVEVHIAANTGGKVFWLGDSNTNSDILWNPELIGYESTIGTTNGRESLLLSNLVDKQDHGHEEVLHNVAFLEEVVVICIHLCFRSKHPEVFQGIVAAIWLRNPTTQIGIVTGGNDDGLGSTRKHLAISKIQARTGQILDNMTGQFSYRWYEDAMSSAHEMLGDYYSTHPRAQRRIILLDGLMDYYGYYDNGSVPLGWSLSEGIPVHCVVTEVEWAYDLHLFNSAYCLQLAEISLKTGGKWFYWQPSDSKAIFNSEELAGLIW